MSRMRIEAPSRVRNDAVSASDYLLPPAAPPDAPPAAPPFAPDAPDAPPDAPEVPPDVPADAPVPAVPDPVVPAVPAPVVPAPVAPPPVPLPLSLFPPPLERVRDGTVAMPELALLGLFARTQSARAVPVISAHDALGVVALSCRQSDNAVPVMRIQFPQFHKASKMSRNSAPQAGSPKPQDLPDHERSLKLTGMAPVRFLEVSEFLQRA